MRRAAGDDPFTTNLRSEFFRKIDTLNPSLASEMVREVGPHFKRQADLTAGGDLTQFAWVARQNPTFIACWQAWARPFGLHHDDWILRQVLAMLPTYLKERSEEDGTVVIVRLFGVAPLGAVTDDTIVLQPGFGSAPFMAAYHVPGRQIPPPEPYQPEKETRAQYEIRVDEYANAVESIAQTLGWTDAPAGDSSRHLEWLVRFQVNAETVKSIADREKQDRRSIRQTLKEIARELGLTRRTVGPE